MKIFKKQNLFSKIFKSKINKQREKVMMEVLETETGTATTSWIKIFLYSLVMALGAVTFLLHIYLPTVEPELKVVQNIRNETRDKIEVLRDSLVSYTASEEFSVSIAKDIVLRLSELEAAEKTQHAAFLEKRTEVSISGFYSRHKFAWHFGIGLLFIIWAIESFISLPKYNGKERKARTFGLFAKLVIAGYYNAWIFYDGADDLGRTVYLYVLLAIGVLSGISGVFIAQVKRKNILWLKYIMLTILSDLKNNDIKNIFKIAIKNDPYNDAYQEALKDSSVELSKKMQDQADEIKKY